MKQLIFCSLFILLSKLIVAQSAQMKPQHPRLVVVVVVEQMRADYIQRYWNKFDKKGFRRLVNEGMVFHDATYSYMLNETGAGYATIATGTTPCHHGIVGQSWYNHKTRETVNCVEDKSYFTVGSRSEIGKASPKNLRSSTLGDELELATLGRSKVMAVALRDCGAILSGGRMADAAYWFDDRVGRWITSSYYRDSLPQWVNDFNYKDFPDQYLKRNWTTLQTLEDYTESLPDHNSYEQGFLKQYHTFPYDLPALNRLTREFSIFKSTCFSNTYTKDFAIELIDQEKLGKDDTPDLLTVGFSATEEVGQTFGCLSVENQEMYLRLDKDLAHLLDYIDYQVGLDNALVVLTSDHGIGYPTKYLDDQGIKSGYFGARTAHSLLKIMLQSKFGKAEWIDIYHNQQFYFDHELIEKRNLLLNDFQDVAAELLKKFTGVMDVIAANKLTENTYPQDYIQKLQRSYYPGRSGDVFVCLQPHWLDESEVPYSYSSGHRYDNHVPLIFYGWQIAQGESKERVHIQDIAPSLAHLLAIPLPAAANGRILPVPLKK